MSKEIIKAAIIDDELHCIKTLRYLIENNFQHVELVFVTTDSLQAKSLIETHKPELIFLDIEMPNINGIELLASFDKIPFKVIFTTAYDQYAIKAIRINALDYLLKPISKDELSAALEKYTNDMSPVIAEQVSQLNLFIQRKITDTIALSTSQGLFFIKLPQIIYLVGDDCYTHVHLVDGTKHIVSKTLANFEEILIDNLLFFRVHKSYIINLNFIKQYVRGDGGEIVMQNNQRITLSRSKKEAFLQLFSKL